MAFDPDKYLAEKAGVGTGAHAGPAFDPDKYLAQKGNGSGAEDDEGPSELESGLRGLAQGASLGFADEIAGGAGALVDKLKGDKRDWSDVYKAERDDSRKKYAAAKEANPLAYGAGNLAGGIGTQAALALATGGASLPAMAAEGAALGGAQALGESTADTAGGDLAETAKGVGLGGLAGLLGGAGGKLAGAALKKAAPALASKLDQLAIAQGRRAITGGADALAQKAGLTGEQVLGAIDQGALKMGDTVGDIAKRTGALREAAANKYSGLVQKLEQAGVTGPETGQLAQQLSDQGADIAANSIGTGVPEMYEGAAKELAGKVESGVIPTDDLSRLSLSRAENIKRSLQDAARSEYTKLGGNGMVGDAKMDIARQVKDAIENQVSEAGANAAEGSEVHNLAKEFVPAKQDLSNLIAVDSTAVKGAEQAARRKAMSLGDSVIAGPALAAAATGHPLALLAPVASHIARTRGASTAAVAARSLSKTLGKVGAAVATDPAKLGVYGGVLSNAMQRGKDAFNATHFVLSQTDPNYQQHVDSLPDE